MRCKLSSVDIWRILAYFYKSYRTNQEVIRLISCVDRFPISLEWNGKVVSERVIWFQYESDPSLNSNVFEVAQGMVQKHFPGK